MLQYTLDDSIQRQQPLVLLDQYVLVKTSSDSAATAVLVTAAGRRHALTQFCPFNVLWQNTLQKNSPAVEAMLHGELPRRIAELRTDSLSYFIDYLVPVFEHRDVSENSFADQPASLPPPELDWTVELRAAARRIPAPEIVAPSLLMLGRLWALRDQKPQSGCMQVLCPRRCLGLSGDFHVVSTLKRSWHSQVTKCVSQFAAELAKHSGGDHVSNLVAQARLELASVGFLERGDLLFIPGNPPRLGYLVPRHHNRVLRRECHRDLAMTVPLTVPKLPTPSKSVLTVYERVGGTWGPVHPPHGLCLGPDAPSYTQESPGIGLAAFLRWAAQRIADNGIFHSGDD